MESPGLDPLVVSRGESGVDGGLLLLEEHFGEFGAVGGVDGCDAAFEACVRVLGGGRKGRVLAASAIFTRVARTYGALFSRWLQQRRGEVEVERRSRGMSGAGDGVLEGGFGGKRVEGAVGGVGVEVRGEVGGSGGGGEGGEGERGGKEGRKRPRRRIRTTLVSATIEKRHGKGVGEEDSPFPSLSSLSNPKPSIHTGTSIPKTPPTSTLWGRKKSIEGIEEAAPSLPISPSTPPPFPHPTTSSTRSTTFAWGKEGSIGGGGGGGGGVDDSLMQGAMARPSVSSSLLARRVLGEKGDVGLVGEGGEEWGEERKVGEEKKRKEEVGREKEEDSSAQQPPSLPLPLTPPRLPMTGFQLGGKEDGGGEVGVEKRVEKVEEKVRVVNEENIKTWAMLLAGAVRHGFVFEGRGVLEEVLRGREMDEVVVEVETIEVEEEDGGVVGLIPKVTAHLRILPWLGYFLRLPPALMDVSSGWSGHDMAELGAHTLSFLRPTILLLSPSTSASLGQNPILFALQPSLTRTAREVALGHEDAAYEDTAHESMGREEGEVGKAGVGDEEEGFVLHSRDVGEDKDAVVVEVGKETSVLKATLPSPTSTSPTLSSMLHGSWLDLVRRGVGVDVAEDEDSKRAQETVALGFGVKRKFEIGGVESLHAYRTREMAQMFSQRQKTLDALRALGRKALQATHALQPNAERLFSETLPTEAKQLLSSLHPANVAWLADTLLSDLTIVAPAQGLTEHDATLRSLEPDALRLSRLAARVSATTSFPSPHRQTSTHAKSQHVDDSKRKPMSKRRRQKGTARKGGKEKTHTPTSSSSSSSSFSSSSSSTQSPESLLVPEEALQLSRGLERFIWELVVGGDSAMLQSHLSWRILGVLRMTQDGSASGLQLSQMPQSLFGLVSVVSSFAKLLGVMWTSPHWAMRGLVEEVRRKEERGEGGGGAEAAVREGVDVAGKAPPPVDIAHVLHHAWKNQTLILTVPWVCAWVKIVATDPIRSKTPYLTNAKHTLLSLHGALLHETSSHKSFHLTRSRILVLAVIESTLQHLSTLSTPSTPLPSSLFPSIGPKKGSLDGASDIAGSRLARLLTPPALLTSSHEAFSCPLPSTSSTSTPPTLSSPTHSSPLLRSPSLQPPDILAMAANAWLSMVGGNPQDSSTPASAPTTTISSTASMSPFSPPSTSFQLQFALPSPGPTDLVRRAVAERVQRKIRPTDKESPKKRATHPASSSSQTTTSSTAPPTAASSSHASTSRSPSYSLLVRGSFPGKLVRAFLSQEPELESLLQALVESVGREAVEGVVGEVAAEEVDKAVASFRQQVGARSVEAAQRDAQALWRYAATQCEVQTVSRCESQAIAKGIPALRAAVQALTFRHTAPVTETAVRVATILLKKQAHRLSRATGAARAQTAMDQRKTKEIRAVIRRTAE